MIADCITCKWLAAQIGRAPEANKMFQAHRQRIHHQEIRDAQIACPDCGTPKEKK